MELGKELGVQLMRGADGVSDRKFSMCLLVYHQPQAAPRLSCASDRLALENVWIPSSFKKATP